ncbi:hypothetical protein GEMRC1_004353 [Eukaryota sp. GEM-RC1]
MISLSSNQEPNLGTTSSVLSITDQTPPIVSVHEPVSFHTGDPLILSLGPFVESNPSSLTFLIFCKELSVIINNSTSVYFSHSTNLFNKASPYTTVLCEFDDTLSISSLQLRIIPREYKVSIYGLFLQLSSKSKIASSPDFYGLLPYHMQYCEKELEQGDDQESRERSHSMSDIETEWNCDLPAIPSESVDVFPSHNHGHKSRHPSQQSSDQSPISIRSSSLPPRLSSPLSASPLSSASLLSRRLAMGSPLKSELKIESIKESVEEEEVESEGEVVLQSPSPEVSSEEEVDNEKVDGKLSKIKEKYPELDVEVFNFIKTVINV